MTTPITNFESAKTRALEIKAERITKKANSAATMSHFATGIAANMATILWLSDKIADQLGLSVTAATLAAAGFNLSHMLWDYFQNQASEKQFAEELANANTTFTSEEAAKLREVFQSTHLFPPQFYPYVQIAGLLVFSGLNFASMKLPDVLADATHNVFFYLSSIGLNIAGGTLFTLGGIPIKANIPAAMAYVVTIANSLGLALAPVQKTILEAFANPDLGKLTLTGAAAGVAATGALAAKLTWEPVKRLAVSLWEKGKACCSNSSTTSDSQTEVTPLLLA